MFRLSKTFLFEASHRLEHYDGACNRLHGHSYTFEVEVMAPIVRGGPNREMAVDYAEIGKVGKLIAADLDHRHLNDVLDSDSPTAELISRWIYDRAKAVLPSLHAVSVSETESTRCRYCPTESMVLEFGKAAIDKLPKRDGG